MNDFINKMGEYWSQLSFDKLGDILTYHHNAPMLFSSGLFFFLFIGFLIIYMSLRKHLLTRIIYVTLFSIYFYYKSSGLFFFLLLFVATSDFCIAQCMTKTASKWGRKAWVVLSLCVDLGLLGYFKYFNYQPADNDVVGRFMARSLREFYPLGRPAWSCTGRP